MNTIELNRKRLNKRQTELRSQLSHSDHASAIQFFLTHHAQLHAPQMAQTGAWSFEAAILADLTSEAFRRIPRNEEHSIVWCIWHLARIEDTAMNFLVAGTDQLASREGWFEKMGAPFRDCGNDMTAEEIHQLSASIHLSVLQAYRVAVGRRTQEIVSKLSPEELKTKVDPARLQAVMAAGALKPISSGIRDYWGNRTIAGLLLMPASRHIIVHLNEALKLKRKKT